MFRYVLGALLAACSLAAQAQTAFTVAKQVEASMLVTGSVDIEADGSVSSHKIDKRERLPDYAVEIIDRAAATWRFEPILVDGRTIPARARMTLRLLAKPQENSSYAVSIASATFGDRFSEGTDYVTKINMRPPAYPSYALDRGVTGTVYLILKIDRSGQVADVMVEQVNLKMVAHARTMTTMRERLATASLAAARRWTFMPPATGEQVDDPFWSLRIPVDYVIGNGSGSDSYGKWETYVPGPRQAVQWAREDDGGNDAIVGGAMQQAGTGIRLLTPLQPQT